jgi:DMSO/TMAO reductase YedYZ molybdopterin-dependent catalytic subunit
MDTLNTASGSLSELITPRPFVRCNHELPRLPGAYTFAVEGAGGRRTTCDLTDLRHMDALSLTVCMECAGNSRRYWGRPAEGLPWDNRAVSNVRWTGVRLSELLGGHANEAGEVVFESYDTPFLRSLPVAALERTPALVAFAMNDRPIPVENGGPVRVVVPGWYGMASVKWLKRLALSRSRLRGVYQTEKYQYYYDDGRTEPVTLLRPKSVITDIAVQNPIRVQGKAWSGRPVRAVELVVNGTALEATIRKRTGPYGWVSWEKVLDLPPGKYRIGSRAHDDCAYQPDNVPFNKLGYGNNAVQYFTLEL